MHLEGWTLPGLRRFPLGARGIFVSLVVLLIGCKAAEWYWGWPSRYWWFWILLVGLAHRTLTRGPILMFSLAGAAAANAGGLWAWQPDAWLRFAVMAVVGASTSLLMGAAIRQRDHVLAALNQARSSLKASEELGARFRALIDSSGVGIMTVSGEGKILTANLAAHRLLDFQGDELAGRFVTSYLPPLGGLLNIHPEGDSFRSEMECRAWSRHGRVFNAQVCFSTFQGPSGPELGVLFNDSTLWAPEEGGVPLAAKSCVSCLSTCVDLHEMRNLAFAIGALCRDFLDRPADEQKSVLETLQNLARGISRLSSRELRPHSEGGLRQLEFDWLTREVKPLLLGLFEGSGVELEWSVPQQLPAVWADSEALLDVFLNLAKNSLNASSEQRAPRVVAVGAIEKRGRVFVRFCDSGTDVESSAEMFQPVRQGPDMLKMGLWVSRALLRTFGGELRSERDHGHLCFVLELLAAGSVDQVQMQPSIAG